MDINSLKLILGAAVFESKLPKEAKLQLLNFIQNEATKHQLMVLMMDGKISVVSESSSKIIEDRFKIFEKEKLKEGAVGSVLGMILFSPLLWAAWRAVGGMLSQAKRKCGTFRIGTERDQCIERWKILVVQKKLEVMKKAPAECAKTKNPEKCKAKVQKKIAKLQNELVQKKQKFDYRWGKKNK